MRDIVKAETGLNYHAQGKWDGEELGTIVFSCVDSMEVRKQILDSMTDGLFIEVRMGVKHGQVFSIDTKSDEDKAFWNSYYCGDDVVEEKSACGTSLTIGSTATLLSSIASWQCIKHMNDEKLSRMIIASVEPYMMQEV